MDRGGSGPESDVNCGSGWVTHFTCGSGCVRSRKLDSRPTLTVTRRCDTTRYRCITYTQELTGSHISVHRGGTKQKPRKM